METVNCGQTAELPLLDYDNPYWKNNPEYFSRLSQLIGENPKGYYRALTSVRKNRKRPSKFDDADTLKLIYEWVLSQTPFLDDPFWEFATKCYCVLHGITSLDQFPRCRTDGKFIKQNVYSITIGFKKQHCNHKCRQNDKCFIDKIIQGKTLKYGNAFGPIEKIKQTKLERYGDENYRNSKKSSATRKAFSKERKAEIEQKKQKTLMKHFGVDSPMRSEELRSKHIQACLKNHGRSFGFDYQKIKQKNNKTFGCDWPMQSKAVRCKSAQTLMAKYGVRNPMQSYEVQKKSKRRYEYGGRTFDSKPELALYIWLSDIGVMFKYNESDGIPYEYDGQMYFYFPDFEIIYDGGRQVFIEIKGKQFFRSDGSMFLPYRTEHMTDSEYKRLCGKYEAKRQCMVQHNVKIIVDPSDEVNSYKKYVEEKYGKEFWQQCRKVNKVYEECN